MHNSFLENLAALYDRHEVELFACALAVTRCRELAADAVHDGFCSLLRRQSDSDAPLPTDLKRYVFRTVRNAALRVVRGKKPSCGIQEEPFLDSSCSPEQLASDAEERERLNRALDSLSEVQREVVLLHLYSDLSFREIAELREDSINTVASWYRRALKALERQLEKG